LFRLVQVVSGAKLVRSIRPPKERLGYRVGFAARAWLDWNQDHLTKKANISKATLNRFEQGLSIVNQETSDRLRRVVEAAGIRFHFRKMVASGIEMEMRETSPVGENR
jgi:hypothetical protein